jgi:hypothetical protein
MRIWTSVVCFIAGCAGIPAQSMSGKEIRFTAGDVRHAGPVWRADTVLLDRWLDRHGDLIFVLENPTETEHAFVMPGVQRVTGERTLTPESSPDLPWPVSLVYTEPVAVMVKPGQRMSLRIHAGDLLAAQSSGKAFPFFCAIHRDLPKAEVLYVM